VTLHKKVIKVESKLNLVKLVVFAIQQEVYTESNSEHKKILSLLHPGIQSSLRLIIVLHIIC
jgi:hypothetical protein